MIFACLLLLGLFLFQQVASPGGADVLTEVVAGGVASFLLSLVKSRANEPGASPWKIKGSTAHVLILVVAVLIALVVRWYLGEINSWTGVLRSAGVVGLSAVSTYQLLIRKLGIEEKKETPT